MAESTAEPWQEPLRVPEAVRTRPTTVRGIVVGTVLAVVLAAGAAGVVLWQPTRYASSSLLIIDQPRLVARSGDAGVVQKLNALRLKYVALVRTVNVVEPVAESLDLPPAEVRRAVGARATPDSLVFVVSAETGDRADAQRIAAALGERIVAYAEEEQAAAGVDPGTRVELHVVEPAGPARAVSPDRSRALVVAAVAAVLGFVVGYGATELLPIRREE